MTKLTEEELTKKVHELIEKTAEAMREKYAKLLKEGQLKLNKYEDNYVLPKIIVCALCKEMAWQWTPLADRKLDKEVARIGRLL